MSVQIFKKYIYYNKLSQAECDLHHKSCQTAGFLKLIFDVCVYVGGIEKSSHFPPLSGGAFKYHIIKDIVCLFIFKAFSYYFLSSPIHY